MIYSGMLLGGLFNEVQVHELNNVIEKMGQTTPHPKQVSIKLTFTSFGYCSSTNLFMMIIMRGYFLPLL